MLSHRFRIYPSKTVQQTLSEHLELCRWLYNRLLEKLNHARTEGRQIEPLRRIPASSVVEAGSSAF